MIKTSSCIISKPKSSRACTHTEVNREAHTVGYDTSLESLPGSSSLLVQIAEVFLLCKFSFGEKAPLQAKHCFASAVGSFQQLPYLSPHVDCKKAELTLHETCLAQLYKSPPTFSQLNFTSICSQSIVEFSNISTRSWCKNTVLVGLNMACMMFDISETLIVPFKAKIPAMLEGSLGSQSCLAILMHTEGTAPLGLEIVGHLWSK